MKNNGARRFRVVVTDPLPEAGLEPLFAAADVTAYESPKGEELLRAIRDADALVTRSATAITREVIAAAPNLKVIGRAGVGIDNIDLDAATERGIVVVNVAEGNTVSVAELVFGMIIGLYRHMLHAHQSVVAGLWERKKYIGEELRGKVLGIIGLGRIGSEVAKRAAVFGMKVIAYDPYVADARFKTLGVERVDFDTLLRTADVVTPHVPLTDETERMLDAAALAKMKPGALLLNTARGPVVDDQALVEALRSGRLAGAGIDVFPVEPPPPGHPLLTLPNVILSPHLGGSTRQSLDFNARTVSEQVLKALNGEPVRGAVNLPPLTDEDWWAVESLMPLAEMLGRFYRDGLGGTLEELDVTVRAAKLPSPRAAELLTGAVLKGLLQGVVDRPVTIVNVHFIAAKRGLNVRQNMKTDESARIPVLEVAGGSGAQRRSVAGSLSLDGAPRLLNLNGMALDMTPSRYLLMTRHRDRPGMIGRVGGILGRYEVNIAAMHVARTAVRGEAIMVLSLDDPASDEAVEEIRRTEGIEDVRVLTFDDEDDEGEQPR